MNLTRVYAIFVRQFYLIRDNSTRFVQMFAWLIVDITLWGFTSRYLNGVTGSTLNLVSLLLGAVLLWNLLIQTMQGITMSFFEDVWSRNFLNIFASPIRVSEYISGLILAGTARSVLALGVMLIFATLIFGLPILIFGTSLALFILILFLFGIALGIIGISIMLRFGPSAEWFVWPIPAILSPFVGVLYPVTILPPWMQAVSWFLPPAYVFAGVRSIVGGEAFPITTLIWGILFSLLYIMLAYWIFLRVYHTVVRTGLIARYSAENLS